MAIPIQAVGIRQSQLEIYALSIDESEISGTTSAGILEGTYHAVIAKNGTGDYTITLNRPARRSVVVIGAAANGLPDMAYQIVSVSSSAVRISWTKGGSAHDADFFITIGAFYKAAQN